MSAWLAVSRLSLRVQSYDNHFQVRADVYPTPQLCDDVDFGVFEWIVCLRPETFREVECNLTLLLRGVLTDGEKLVASVDECEMVSFSLLYKAGR